MWFGQGYSSVDISCFFNEYKSVSTDSNHGEFAPFDLTLTTAWGEAGWALPRKYALLDDNNLVRLFQGLVQIFFTSLLSDGD
jgi:hypothetical protein